MTDVQKMQVAAMAQEGMSIDEITKATKLQEYEVRSLVTERNRQKRKLSNKTIQSIINWYKTSGSMPKTANHFGVSTSAVHRIITQAKSDPDAEPKAEPEIIDVEVTEVKEQPKTADVEVTIEVTEVKKQPKTIEAEEQPTKTNDTTKIVECQALSGVDMVGVIQSMLIAAEENFGSIAEIFGIMANMHDAQVKFTYKGESYMISFNKI